ncbi:hypothetical protein [Frateuria flava]|uniref:hypothetical protein n=1 Tax=Frateuria flava TaxID=2821489 RepID=UPI001AE85DB8|nr:hypothetical protein [Frateuria flava]
MLRTRSSATLIEGTREAAHEPGCSRMHWQMHERDATPVTLDDRLTERGRFVVYRPHM